jgi:hypothetical protein
MGDVDVYKSVLVSHVGTFGRKKNMNQTNEFLSRLT